MVFTAITYGALTVNEHRDAWRGIRSATLIQTATAAAGGEVYIGFPGAAGDCVRLSAIFWNKNLRIKSIVIDGSTLAAPIQVYGLVWSEIGKYFAETPTVTLTDNGIESMTVSDCIFGPNWAGLIPPLGFLTWYTSALTLNDYIVTWVQLEVVD